MDDRCCLTLLSINAALRESYQALSLHVRVPYKFLAPEDLRHSGFFRFISAILSEKAMYHGHGMIILPSNSGIGRVVLCNVPLGEHAGMPSHKFASTAAKRGLLARYIAAILLAGSLGFSGFSGDARRKRKTALGIMSAAGAEHYRQFSHSNLVGDLRKTLSVKCDRVRSDLRELGITDTDLLYALEKKPSKAEETALMLRNEISEIEALLWLAEKKKKAQISDRTAKHIAIYIGFLKRTLAALARVYVARHRWDQGQSSGADKRTPCWKALRAIAASERIPAGDLRNILEGMQPAKARIFRAVI